MSTPPLRLNLARIVLFVLFAWLICDTAVAATYYIRPDGGGPRPMHRQG